MPDSFPYPTVAPDAVRDGAWTIADADGSAALPEWLPDWDLSQRLTASRRLEVDLDRVYAETHIDADAGLAISVVYGSDFEDIVEIIDIDEQGGTFSAQLTVDLPGELLGETVELTTSLILRDNSHEAHDHIAWRRGSVLWSDIRRTRLHGDGSRFPVTELDFADHGLDPATPWLLEVGAEFATPAMGAVQLLLNSRFPLVLEAARELDPTRPELAVLRSALHADIGRTLVEHALAQEIEQEWPDDSLGAILAGLLASHFPESVVELRALRERDAAGWAARLAATFGLFREPLR